MAELEKHGNRKDWLRWAIEFLRRGIWIGEVITVHGPHPSAPYMWGEVDGWVDWFPPTVDTKTQISNGLDELRVQNGIGDQEHSRCSGRENLGGWR